IAAIVAAGVSVLARNGTSGLRILIWRGARGDVRRGECRLATTQRRPRVPELNNQPQLDARGTAAGGSELRLGPSAGRVLRDKDSQGRKRVFTMEPHEHNPGPIPDSADRVRLLVVEGPPHRRRVRTVLAAGQPA